MDNSNLTSQPFPYFKLPREVRDMILFYHCGNNFVYTQGKPHLAMDQSMPWRARRHPNSTISIVDRTPLHPRIREIPSGFFSRLGVSRQFYEEAATMFYKSTTFSFEDNVRLKALLNKLPERYQNLIRVLTFDISVEEADTWKEFLRKRGPVLLSGLRKVDIRVGGPGKGISWDMTEMDGRVLSSVGRLKEARVSAKYVLSEARRKAFDKEEMGKVFERLALGLD